MLSDRTQLRLVNSIDDAMDMKRWLSEDRNRDIIAIDTETSGLSAYKQGARLRLVQMGDYETGWSVPWDQWGGVFMECLNAWKGPIVAHNLPFDGKFLQKFANWNIPWARMHDTLVHAHIIEPGVPAGLKERSAIHVDPRIRIGEQKLKEAFKKGGYDWDTVPIELEAYWAYGALDTVATAHLFKHYRADQSFPEVYDLEMATLRICAEMERRGARIDVDYCVKKRDELAEKTEQIKKYAQETFGVLISSPDQLVDYFTKREAKFTSFTEKGAPSVDIDQLKFFKFDPREDIRTLAEIAVEFRKADKLRGSYFENFLNNHDNGIVHPKINTMGAITGRMSITNPALQTLPSDDSIVRNAIIASEGNMLAMSDLDQVEFRFFSVLAEDYDLQQTFIRADEIGSDAFTEIGREVYSDPNMQKSDLRRKLVKTYIYSSLYGAGIRKQALSADVSIEVMQGVSDKMNSRFPGMKKFQKSMIDIVKKRWIYENDGYILTPTTGRKLPIPEDKGYKATNFAIQSSCADIFKQNLVKLDASGLGPYLVAPVHDEIIMDIPISELKEVMPIALECMTNSHYSVPLTAGLDGPYKSWGVKYSGK